MNEGSESYTAKSSTSQVGNLIKTINKMDPIQILYAKFLSALIISIPLYYSIKLLVDDSSTVLKRLKNKEISEYNIEDLQSTC